MSISIHSECQARINRMNLLFRHALINQWIKYFRSDEDFMGSLATLRSLVTLDFDSLFCAHRPHITGGKQALLEKLANFEVLEQKVRSLNALGLDIDEITQRILCPEDRFIRWFTSKDASKRNIVTSILQGPIPRPDAVI